MRAIRGLTKRRRPAGAKGHKVLFFKRPIFSLLVLSALSGCASVGSTPDMPATATGDGAEDPGSQADADLVSADRLTSPESSGVDGEAVGPDASLQADEADVRPEDFEEGFCADDIYAKYLTAQYQSTHPLKGGVQHKPQKLSHSRHGRHNRRHDAAAYDRKLAEFAGLSYAHGVMAGKTSPYFGALPIVVNDKVDFWVQYFKSSGRQAFMRWLVRGESVKAQVQPILQERGVPMEFFYLAMIESGLSNKANSKARAIGTWQFMRGTARLYGLKIDRWVDERRDPVKSTIAAARYLKDLYFDLGDWHLAMAAYNAGPGKVRKALRRNDGADFWQLCATTDLARETKEYVPKVLAAVLLAAEPKAHGFVVSPDGAEAVPDAEVILKHSMKLTTLAHHLDLPVETLRAWNPELLRDATPPTKSGYPLRLTAHYASLLEQNAASWAAVSRRYGDGT